LVAFLVDFAAGRLAALEAGFLVDFAAGRLAALEAGFLVDFAAGRLAALEAGFLVDFAAGRLAALEAGFLAAAFVDLAALGLAFGAIARSSCVRGDGNRLGEPFPCRIAHWIGRES
jgi:hypothetical protein